MGKNKRILLLIRDAGTASDLKARLERQGHDVLDPASPSIGEFDAALLELPSRGGIPPVAAVPGAGGPLPMPCDDGVLEAAVQAAFAAGEAALLLRRGGEGVRGLFALSGEVVVITDRGGRILLFSSAAERLFGRAPEAVRGTHFVQLLDGGARERYAASAAQILEGGTVAPLKMDALRADGTLFPAVLRLNVLALEEGLCVATLIRPAASDPFHTEVRKIAHDINNTLAAILGYSELARDSLEDREALKEYTGELLKASGKAQELVAQLMRIARRNP